jgi:hypothetical protein
VETPDHAGYRLACDQVVERPARDHVVDGLVRDQVVDRRARDQVVERLERPRIIEGRTRDQVVECVERDQVVEGLVRDQVVDRERGLVGALSPRRLHDHVVEAATAGQGVEALSGDCSNVLRVDRENSVGDAEMSSG